MPPHFLFHLLIISASFAHSPRHNTSLPFFLFSHDRFFSSTIYWTASKFLLDVLFFFQILFYPPFLSPASSLHRRISSLNSTCLSTDSPNYVLYSEANLFLSSCPSGCPFLPTYPRRFLICPFFQKIPLPSSRPPPTPRSTLLSRSQILRILFTLYPPLFL